MSKRKWHKLGAGVLAALLLGMASWTGTVAAEPAETAAAAEQAEVNKRIVINLAARSIALFKNDEKVYLFPIGPGKASTPTPTGYYEIKSKDVDPSWTDPATGYSIASGEDCPLGYRWMQIYGNYGIHGTNNPDSIGHYVSNGCIRMYEEDVEKLFDAVDVGTPVEITYNRVVVEKAPDSTIVYYIYPDGYGWQSISVADVKNWLKGYGVENFESDAAIEKKISASDGEPTYIAKVYPLFVNGKKVDGKAVVQGDVTYLPVVDVAQTLNVSTGWRPNDQVLVSAFGEAVGYNKKDVLYCNADDAAKLFHVDGGLTKKGTYELKTVANTIVPVVRGEQPLPDNNTQGTPAPNTATPGSAATDAAKPDTATPGTAATEPAKPNAAAPATQNAPRSAAEAEQQAQAEAAATVKAAQQREADKEAAAAKAKSEASAKNVKTTRTESTTTVVKTNR